VDERLPRTHSPEDLAFYSQPNKAEGIKLGIDHQRRLKCRCWGLSSGSGTTAGWSSPGR